MTTFGGATIPPLFGGAGGGFRPDLPSFNGGIHPIIDFNITKSISTQTGQGNASRFQTFGPPYPLQDLATAAFIQNYQTGGNPLSFEASVIDFTGTGACAIGNVSVNSFWPDVPTLPGMWVNLGFFLSLGFASESSTGNGTGSCIFICEIRPGGGGASLARWRQSNDFVA